MWNKLPYLSNLAMDCCLTKQDLFGEVRLGRFIIHKLPEHVVRIYQAFGCGEERLKQMHRAGITKVQIFFHPNTEVCEYYETTIEAWRNGIEFKNKLPSGRIERQRLLRIDDLEEKNKEPTPSPHTSTIPGGSE